MPTKTYFITSTEKPVTTAYNSCVLDIATALGSEFERGQSFTIVNYDSTYIELSLDGTNTAWRVDAGTSLTIDQIDFVDIFYIRGESGGEEYHFSTWRA